MREKTQIYGFIRDFLNRKNTIVDAVACELISVTRLVEKIDNLLVLQHRITA